jgi:carboxypeptidase T
MIGKSQKLLLKTLLATFVIAGLSQIGSSTDAPTFAGRGHFRYIVKTQVTSPGQLTQLSRWLSFNEIDVAGMNWHKGEIEIVTNQTQVNFLTSKGFSGHVVMASEGGLDPRYLNPQTLEAKLKAINQAFPNLTHLEQIGSSLQGRPIWALLISDTPSPNDPKYWAKPTLLFDGQHHAREVMTSEVVADVADTMLKGAQSNQAIQGLLHRWNIWIIPMLNVDGTNIVFTRDSDWRKNARGDQSSVYGVDINRNYPYKWAACHGSSNSKGAQDYHGTAENSEPETVAMVNFATKIRPTASLSYHSYSEFVLYPYGCQGELTPEKVLVEKIANELAAKLPSDDGQGHYAPGTPWQLLYDVDGDSMDFMYASFGSLSYTFEINQAFQPNYSLRDPTLAKERNAWGYFLTRIDANLLHVSVVDGKTGRPSESFIDIDAIQKTQGELAYKTNVGGHYFKVLDPGHYIVSAKLADGRVGKVEVQMSGQPQSVTLNIP